MHAANCNIAGGSLLLLRVTDIGKVIFHISIDQRERYIGDICMRLSRLWLCMCWSGCYVCVSCMCQCVSSSGLHTHLRNLLRVMYHVNQTLLAYISNG